MTMLTPKKILSLDQEEWTSHSVGLATL